MKRVLVSLLIPATIAFAASCSEDTPDPSDETGGSSGASSGGTPATGGSANGGASGSATGGASGSATGGATATGGSATGGSATGGSATGGTETGGSTTGGASGAATGGTTTGGSGGAGPSGGTGGSAGAGAVSGSGGSGAASTGGSAGAAGASACPASCTSSPASSAMCAPCFSFFATSLEAMRMVSGNQNGFGGDLRFGEADGLSGADKICRTIATDIAADPMTIAGRKTWRAFLSVTLGPGGMPVHARDRIGTGPWYDRTGRLLAANLTNLLNTRPTGADPAIRDDFPNEQGVPNHGACTGCANPQQCCDNHDFLTGTGPDGRLYTGGSSGAGGAGGGFLGSCSGIACTCKDWTSKVGADGKPWCGHSWPRMGSGENWMSALPEGGCAPGVFLEEMGGPRGDTVGGGGGYGGIYCFAILN